VPPFASVQTPVEAVVLIVFLIAWSGGSLLLLLDYRGSLGWFTARSSRWQGVSVGFYRVGFVIAFVVGAVALVPELAGIAVGRVG
jgi:hypothetical protein